MNVLDSHTVQAQSSEVWEIECKHQQVFFTLWRLVLLAEDMQGGLLPPEMGRDL